eukprot:jgi/Mesen1/2151/ME000152S01238
MLGGGKTADVLLWKEWKISASILGVVAMTYILFEWSGYTLLTLLANTLLILVVAVFVWAQAAHLLNRAPPPLPKLVLSEDQVMWFGNVVRTEVNRALAIAHSVALGNDYKLFAKVVVALYAIATIGAWFNFLSLTFVAVFLSFTLPVFYDKYEDQVDAQLKKGLDKFHELYAVVEQKVKQVLRKIPHEKKAQ